MAPSLKRLLTNELHKPARKNFARRKFLCGGLDDLWQMDLADVRSYSAENAGHSYILVAIDCYSRYAWTVPLKNKTGECVATSFDKLLKSSRGRVPRNLLTDRGTEFYNSHFSKIANRHDIRHYSTFSSMKASMAERLIRTLKTWMFKEFSFSGKYEWIRGVLSDATLKYNERKHRVTGARPLDVVRGTAVPRPATSSGKKKPRFGVGDAVRISKFKSQFRKGYLPSWSTELFKITEVRRDDPPTFLLEDDSGDPVRGCFYAEELSKIDDRLKNVYLVEKVLKRSGDRIYVRWLGFDSSRDSWINKKDLVK